MKVILADPPAKERKYDNSYPNVGILYILSYLRHEMPDITLRYLESDHDITSHLAFLRTERPDIYGISFTSKTFRLAKDTLEAIRGEFPHLLLVCGGPHATAMAEDVLNRTPVDVVVVGEGETSFCDLVHHFSERRDLSTCPGLVIRKNGNVYRTPPRKLIADLDSIPFPAWDLIDHKKYPGMHLKRQPIESSLVISRGCPFDCTFCSNPVWKQSKPWIRYRSAANILDEIHSLYDRGVREIYFASDEMNFSLSWSKALLRRIVGETPGDLYFQCNLRVDKLDSEFAELLSKARFWLVHVGMESANDRVLSGLEKHITSRQISDGLALLSSHGIKVFGFMMLYNAWEDAGRFCYETTEEVDNSLRFCSQLFRQRHIHYMSWQFCTPMPGARLYDIARCHGVFSSEETDMWERFDEHAITMHLPGIDPREMRNRIRKGIILKDLYMIRSGGISLRHLWRAWENIGALVRFH